MATRTSVASTWTCTSSAARRNRAARVSTVATTRWADTATIVRTLSIATQTCPSQASMLVKVILLENIHQTFTYTIQQLPNANNAHKQAHILFSLFLFPCYFSFFFQIQMLLFFCFSLSSMLCESCRWCRRCCCCFFLKCLIYFFAIEIKTNYENEEEDCLEAKRREIKCI